MLGGKGRSLVVMGTFFLTAGFGYRNWYLIIVGIFFLFATFVSRPAFESSMNIEELKVSRKLDNTRIFRDDFMHVVVSIENTSGNRFDFLDIFDEFPTGAFRLVTGENYISTASHARRLLRISRRILRRLGWLRLRNRNPRVAIYRGHIQHRYRGRQETPACLGGSRRR